MEFLSKGKFTINDWSIDKCNVRDLCNKAELFIWLSVEIFAIEKPIKLSGLECH